MQRGGEVEHVTESRSLGSKSLERVTRIELATYTLGTCRSTN